VECHWTHSAAKERVLSTVRDSLAKALSANPRMENTMITKEQIESEIGALEREQLAIQKVHDQMVKDRAQREQAFQQQLVHNQNRFQQLQGAISTLKKLLNGQHPPDTNGESS
jgi:hypothetical protein